MLPYFKGYGPSDARSCFLQHNAQPVILGGVLARLMPGPAGPGLEARGTRCYAFTSYPFVSSSSNNIRSDNNKHYHNHYRVSVCFATNGDWP